MNKPLLDEIDALLAAHYGLSEEELDFPAAAGQVVINYDIKYRSPMRHSRFGDGAMGTPTRDASAAEGDELGSEAGWIGTVGTEVLLRTFVAWHR